MTTAELHDWVARSCDEQGVPFHVEDTAAIARVTVLMRDTN